MSNTGRTCKVHYTGTFNDGTKFDSSYDRGEPIEFVCGAGQMIPGFDQAVEGMNVGDIIDVHLRPEDAYGMPDPIPSSRLLLQICLALRILRSVIRYTLPIPWDSSSL